MQNIDNSLIKSLYTIAKTTTQVIENKYNTKPTNKKVIKKSIPSKAIQTNKEYYNENEPINFFNTNPRPDAITLTPMSNISRNPKPTTKYGCIPSFINYKKP